MFNFIIGSVVAVSLLLTPFSPAISPLSIQGNHFVDSSGNTVQLQGVNMPSLEYTCSNAAHFSTARLAVLHKWHVNAIRLPLNASYYLDMQNSCPHYKTQLDTIVADAEAQNYYVILSLFWIRPINKGSIKGAGYPMPDDKQSVAFWKSLAAHYKNNSNVLFELYSEPHNISNKCWRDGCTIVSKAGGGRVAGKYKAIGMQALFDLVHGIAPKRILLINGPNWGGITGLTVAAGYGLHGQNLAYTVHLYNTGPNNPNPANWPSTFGNLAKKYPVVAAEFGDISHNCDPTWLNRLMPYMRSHTAGYLAWAWSNDPHICKQPSLVTNYDTGTPTTYGAPIFAFYKHY